MSQVRHFTTAFLLIVLGTLAVHQAWAGDLYVDNRDGDDYFDGRADHQIDLATGPVKSIRRALEKVTYGQAETIHLANHGMPYRESLEIVGSRFCGGVRIEGNGAVVSGARPVPADAWKFQGQGVWKFTPFRKGSYQFARDGQALPEFRVPANSRKLPAIPAGQWAAWQGSIYYHALPSLPGAAYDATLEFAVEGVGLTLLDAADVVIQDLEFRHFRLDGINAHDRCRDVVFERVKLIENGRAGLAVGGSSHVGIIDSELRGNRLGQVLNTERAKTEIVATEFTSPVGAGILRKGGTVLVNEEMFR
ncbi:MAG: right-handed parallel beta-helix repeat-containing protein [Planctomycetes bacterium]|nr:right-handed parallel beta-helix repeat-containing protein [Planctomycetota bacterium]